MRETVQQLGDLVRLEGLKNAREQGLPLGLLKAPGKVCDELASRIENHQAIVVDGVEKMIGGIVEGLEKMPVDFFGEKISWEKWQEINAENSAIATEMMSGPLFYDEDGLDVWLHFFPQGLADHIAQFDAGQLLFKRLKALSPEDAGKLAAGKTVCVEFPDDILTVENVRMMNKSLAIAVDERDGLKMEALRELVKGGTTLAFDLKKLTVEMAEILAEHKESLHIRGMAKIDLEAARALSRYQGCELFLDIQEVDSVELAEALIKYHGHLSLPLVQNISDEVARVLAEAPLLSGNQIADLVDKYRVEEDE